MKVVLVVVSSLNGKITKGKIKNVRSWSSKEDQKYFSSLIQKNNLIVMGRETYEAARSVIMLSPNKLRIVLTRNPERFKRLEVKGQLEFTNDSPSELVRRMEMAGYKTMLFVGGSIISSLFFKENKIDEVWITLEPYIFGRGKNLLQDSNLNLTFNLISLTKLNKKGSLLLKYSIVIP